MTVCGPGPYATINARVTSLTTKAPVVGATVTADPGPCPTLSVTTDSNGVATLRVTLDAGINPRVEAPGYLTERAGEQVYRGDYDGGGWMAPTVAAGALPHFDVSKPDMLALLVGATPDGGGAPCTSVDGATFSVPGHPEAVVTYYQPAADGGLPTADTTLTSTTSAGAAEISGLASGQTVQIQVTSPTCSTASFKSYPLTGSFYLENGTLTLAVAYLVPTP